MKKLWIFICIWIVALWIPYAYRYMVTERVESEINVESADDTYYPEKVYWIDCNTKIWKGLSLVSEKWVGMEVWPKVYPNQVDSIKNVAKILTEAWELQGKELIKIHNQ